MTTPAASGLMLNGRLVPVPGLEIVSFASGAVPRTTDGRARTADKISAVVIHTTRGVAGARLRPGSRASVLAESLARYQASTTRDVSWDFTVDTDGTVVQSNDPGTWYTWHAEHANGYSIGIEMVQQQDSPDLWQAQIDATVRLVTVLCEVFNIPKVTVVNASGAPESGIVRDWQEADEGGRQLAFNGVAGHRNLTRNKGPGDPGDLPFQALLAAGFRGVLPAVMTRAPGQPPARLASGSSGSSGSRGSVSAGALTFLALAMGAAAAIVWWKGH
jgi:hypothetical protein